MKLTLQKAGHSHGDHSWQDWTLGHATGDYSPSKHLHRHVPTPCQEGDLRVSVKDTGVRAPTPWPSYDQTEPCFPITVFTIKVKKT